MSKFDKNRKGRTIHYVKIDVPYDKRMDCFYCGSIASQEDHVPPVTRISDYKALWDKHIPLLVPSCAECNSLLDDSIQPDLYQRFDYAKVLLTKKIGKYIRMGELWTEEDIEYADFSGELSKSMEAIPRMAKISKERLDYMHWPISIGGETLERCTECAELKMDGKVFTNMDYAFEYARKVHAIPPKYLEHVVDIVGMKRLDYAFNLCKTVKVKSDSEMKAVLLELKDEQLDMENKR